MVFMAILLVILGVVILVVVSSSRSGTTLGASTLSRSLLQVRRCTKANALPTRMETTSAVLFSLPVMFEVSLPEVRPRHRQVELLALALRRLLR